MSIFNSPSEEVAKLERECIHPLKQDFAVVKTKVDHLEQNVSSITNEIHEIKIAIDSGNKELMAKMERNHEKSMEYNEKIANQIDGNFTRIDNSISVTNDRIDKHEVLDAKDHGVVKGMVWILGGLISIGGAFAAIGIHFNWF